MSHVPTSPRPQLPHPTASPHHAADVLTSLCPQIPHQAICPCTGLVYLGLNPLAGFYLYA